MVGLRTARVIVIDDDEEDAQQIIEALWKLRIAGLYFKDASEVPPENERLCGVRLAFLDMDLVPGTTNEKAKIATLVNLIKQILSPRNGPFAVAAWTKHSELVSRFNQYILEQNMPRPISCVTIAKSDCKTHDGTAYDLTKITSRLNKQLAAFSPLLFLQAWEEQSFLAASDVTYELSKLAEPTEAEFEKWRSEWRTKLLQIVYAMALAAAGKKNLTDGAISATSFYGALNPLLADRLEAGVTELIAELTPSTPEMLSAEAKRGCGISVKANINSMLHFSFEGLEKFQAGSVYKAQELNVIPDLDVLTQNFVNGDPSSGTWKAEVERIKRISYPVLVEANTACDHAQKKVRLARLIAGLIIPLAEIEKKAEERLIKKAEFLWEFGPIALNIDGRSGEYFLVANSLFVLDANLDQLKTIRAWMRLRGQAFTDFLFWFGNHASRPGMMLLRSQD